VILAGDIGGTKTILGLFTLSDGRPRLVRAATYSSSAAASLDEIVRAFLGEGSQKVRRCAVGVAGPVVGGRSSVVNLPWCVDEGRLARLAGVPRARVINDLEATAWGLAFVPHRKLVTLNPGARPTPGNAALIAAGTGLGTAVLFWDGRRHHPSASEGGHVALAPRDEREIGLLRFAQRRFPRVSLDRILSGSGLSLIYDYLVESEGILAGEATLLPQAEDRNAAIAEAGLSGRSAAARRALGLFVSLYGAAAGDLALVARATAGVYLAGGIAPKILPALRSTEFTRSFRSKGRLSPFMKRIPVRVVLEPRTALLGAAACAAHEDASFGRRRRSPARRSPR
jgi:glucokinase